MIFHSYVSLPEGKWLNLGNLSEKNIGITNMICDCMLAFFGLMSLIQSAGVAKHVHWMICFYDQRWRRDIHFSIHHWWLFTRHFPVIYIYITWLVVWNIFYFSIYWECHHPNWLNFSEGLKPPARHVNQVLAAMCCMDISTINSIGIADMLINHNFGIFFHCHLFL